LIFDKKINPARISNGLLTGLIIAGCNFCRWGVSLKIKQIASQTAWIDVSELFENDTVYAQHCIKEIKELLPSCYVTKLIENRVLLIKIDEDIGMAGKGYG
jgi:hypothetical protein